MATARRPKWHPQPPPTPRILHLPRRTYRRKTTTKNNKGNNNNNNNNNNMLEKLFDQERAFSYTIPPIVLLNSEEQERGKNVNNAHAPENEGECDDNKWRFQAEMLRAECNFLRMQREVANKKLERERVFLEKSFKSAVHSLLSGKKKLHEGESANLVLEEEIEDLAKKLIELQRSSKVKSPETRKCSNFDKQASLLQKQLEKYNEMQDENCVKEVPEVSAISLPVNSTRNGKIKGHGSCRRSTRLTDVELLRRKVEGLSKGKLLKKMEEEYGYMLSATASYSAHSSASTSKRYDLVNSSSISYQQSLQDAKSGEHKTCSGRCKAIVRRIMEQVKAETEQWSQMQEMLGQVKEEMEELQASRDFWEEQALESEKRIQTLHSDAEDWKQKAVSFEVKENQLQKQILELQQELEKLKAEKSSENEHHVKVCKDSTPISLGAQLAKEKRILMCRLKGINQRSESNNNNNQRSENNNNNNQRSENADKKDVENNDGTKTVQKSSNKLASLNRHPLKEISNASPLVRQNSRRYVYPLHNPKDF